MRYRIVMSDTVTDSRIERVIESRSVFDAIDTIAAEIDSPEETELIEAIPI